MCLNLLLSLFISSLFLFQIFLQIVHFFLSLMKLHLFNLYNSLTPIKIWFLRRRCFISLPSSINLFAIYYRHQLEFNEWLFLGLNLLNKYLICRYGWLGLVVKSAPFCDAQKVVQSELFTQPKSCLIYTFFHHKIA